MESFNEHVLDNRKGEPLSIIDKYAIPRLVHLYIVKNIHWGLMLVKMFEYRPGKYRKTMLPNAPIQRLKEEIRAAAIMRGKDIWH